MKKLLFTLLAVCFSAVMFAVTTTKTVGGSGADYLTLKAAFDNINAGTITGDIVLQIVANSSESNSTTSIFSLNASGAGSASYTSVLIYPTAPTLTIQGNDATRLAITLNGADNVTIDGRLHDVSGTILSQEVNLSFNGTSPVFKFTADASSNAIRYCNINIGTGGNYGIYITTGVSTGNDNITIENNNIGAATPTMTRYGINVDTSPVGAENDNLQIKNNNLFNLIRTTNGGSFVNIGNFCRNFIISGNSFYLTSTLTGDVGNSAISISGQNNSGHLIENNFIGGNAPQCSGTFTINRTTAGSSDFTAIGVNKSVANDPTVIIRNNTIKNIEFGANITSGNITAIKVSGSNLADNAPIEIYKNFISNINILGTAALIGIYNLTGTSTESNNIINLTHNGGGEIKGIAVTMTDAATRINIYHNTVYIGGSVTNNNNSYAYYISSSKPVTTLTNNIFINTRSTTSPGTGKNYAAYIGSYWASNTLLNYNAYIASGTGGVLGYNGGDKTALPLSATTDANSISPTLSFTISSPSVPSDYISKLIDLVAGTTIAAVTTDFAGTTRAATPTIGAYERDLDTSIDRGNEISNALNVVSVQGGIKLDAVSAQVYNFSGQQVWKGNVNNRFIALPVGKYIVKAISANGINNVKKVIVK